VDTRATLLDAARAEFAERGYDGATVRVIAERAGVDPAMVNHWFGGKETLFTAALDMPLDPTALIADLLPGDPERLGERIVHRFLTIWDHTGGGRRLAALVRSVASHDIAARMMRQFVGMFVRRVVSSAAPDQVELRTALRKPARRGSAWCATCCSSSRSRRRTTRRSSRRSRPRCSATSPAR
jgi:AcrR family transcriptional regulator